MPAAREPRREGGRPSGRPPSPMREGGPGAWPRFPAGLARHLRVGDVLRLALLTTAGKPVPVTFHIAGIDAAPAEFPPQTGTRIDVVWAMPASTRPLPRQGDMRSRPPETSPDRTRSEWFLCAPRRGPASGHPRRSHRRRCRRLPPQRVARDRAIAAEAGGETSAAYYLEALAAVASQQDNPQRAVPLLAAALATGSQQQRMAARLRTTRSAGRRCPGRAARPPRRRGLP